MASIVDVLGYLSYPVTIGLFMSPIPTIRAMAVSGSAQGFDPLPYLVALLQCSLWASYGLFTGAGSSVLGVNVAGAILQFFYVACFFSWSDAAGRRKIGSSLALILCSVSAFGGVIIALQPVQGATIIASVAIIFNVGMFASPISSVRVAVRTGDTSRVPIPLTVASSLCSGLWLTYGVLLGDWFIAGPNAADLCLSLVQLLAVCTVLYSNRKLASDKGAMKRNTSTAAFLPADGASTSEVEQAHAADEGEEHGLDVSTGLDLHGGEDKPAATVDWAAASPSTPRILSMPSLVGAPGVMTATSVSTIVKGGSMKGRGTIASAVTLSTAPGTEHGDRECDLGQGQADDADVGIDMDAL